jgi:hypothetical protein
MTLILEIAAAWLAAAIAGCWIFHKVITSGEPPEK